MIKILIFLSIIILCIYFFFGNKISTEYKKYFIIFFIVAISLLLIFSGKLNFLPVALAPALLFFRRISSLLSLFNLFSRSSFGNKIKPKIKTKYLNIEINIQSRNANIEIIDGKFKDKNLTQLTKNQVEELLSELKTNDIRGFNILNLLINQSFQNSQSSSSSGSMTEEEALSILGLEKGADDEEIRKSYYNLMKKFHPDKDGNNYLSNLITEAKNKLLKQ